MFGSGPNRVFVPSKVLWLIPTRITQSPGLTGVTQFCAEGLGRREIGQFGIRFEIFTPAIVVTLLQGFGLVLFKCQSVKIFDNFV